MKCYEINGQVFTLDEMLNYLQETNVEFSDALFNRASEHYAKLEKETLTEGQRHNLKGKSMSVSKLLGNEIKMILDEKVTAKRLVPGFDMQNYLKEVKENLLKKYKGVFTGDSLNDKVEEVYNEELEELIDNEIEELKTDLSHVHRVGDVVHKLMSVALTSTTGTRDPEFNKILNNFAERVVNPKSESDKILSNLALGGYTQDELDRYGSTLKSEISKKIIKNVNEETTRIKKLFPGGFFSERSAVTDKFKLADVSDTSNISAVMDVVGVLDGGNIQIIDFKVSRKHFADWSAAKKYRTDYQLGFYRQILAQKGFNANDISLAVSNFVVPKGRILDMSLDNALNRTNDNDKHLGKNGDFQQNLEAILPTGVQELFRQIGDESQTIDKLTNGIEQLVNPYSTNNKQVDKEKLFTFVRYDEKLHGDKKYKFFDKLTEKYIYGTKEDFLKEGGLLDEYIKRSIQDRQELTSNVTTRIQEFKSNKDDTERIFITNNQITSEINNVLKEHLGVYVNDNYKILDIPELAHFNIIAVQHTNPKTNEKMIDFISLVNLPLSTNINQQTDDDKTHYIFGKHMTDKEVDGLNNGANGFEPMSSTLNNMEFIKILSIINTIPEMINSIDGKIGKIKVLNYYKGMTSLPNVDNLLKNFNQLCKVSDVQNNLRDMKFASVEDMCLSEMIDMSGTISSESVQTQIQDLINDLSDMNVTEKIKRVRRMRKLLESVDPDVKSKDLNFDKPIIKVYYYLSELQNKLMNIDFEYHGKISKQGIQISEFTNIGHMFLGNNPKDPNKVSTGIALGLEQSTPLASASEAVRKISGMYSAGYNGLRMEFNKKAVYVNKMCKTYFKAKSNLFNQTIMGNDYSLWENLLVRDGQGNVDPEFRVIDPNSKSELDTLDKNFINEIMWEIKKHTLSGIKKEDKELHYKGNESYINNIEQVKNAKESGKYWLMPIARASRFQTARQSLTKLRTTPGDQIKKYFNRTFDTLRDAYDGKLVHKEVADTIQESSQTEVLHAPNVYQLADDMRGRIIENNGVDYCSFDFNFLALDVTFEYMKQGIFDNLIDATRSMLTVMQYRQKYNNEDFSNEIDAIKDRRDSALLDKYLIGEEWTDTVKTLSVVKKLNSALVLSCRPLLFVKEMTLGIYKGYNRALGNSKQNGHFKAASMTKAIGIVHTHFMSKIDNLSKGGDYSDFTKIQQLNALYGMANMDINVMVDKLRNTRFGLEAGISRFAYIWSIAPDFFNRMVFLVAEMIENDCFDAYTMVDGQLHYDFKKDGRFKLLNKHGFNYESTNADYLKEKALYRVMLDDFNKTRDITNSEFLQFGDDLPQAFSTKQKDSIKEHSDLAYGFYDHETRALIDLGVWGAIFKQFKTYITGQKTYWLRSTSEEGENGSTAMGRFDQKKDDNGNLLYRKEIIKDNKVVGVELTTDSNNGLNEPAMTWIGDFTEGMVLSLAHTIGSLFKLDFKGIIGNKGRMGNLKKLMSDMLFFGMMYVLFNLLMGDSDKRNKDGTYKDAAALKLRTDQLKLLRMLRQEVIPWGDIQMDLDISSIGTANRLGKSIWNMFTEDDTDLRDVMKKNIMSIKDMTQVFGIEDE